MSMSKQAQLGEKADSSQQAAVGADIVHEQKGLGEAAAGTGAAPARAKAVITKCCELERKEGDDRDVPERRQYWPGTCTEDFLQANK